MLVCVSDIIDTVPSLSEWMQDIEKRTYCNKKRGKNRLGNIKIFVAEIADYDCNMTGVLSGKDWMEYHTGNEFNH